MQEKQVKNLAVILCVFGLGISFFVYFRTPPPLPSEHNAPYFIPLSFHQFTPGWMPCVKVEIQEKECVFGFDLGFRGYLSAEKEVLSEIQNKSLVSTRSMWGLLGIEHPVNVYKIPKFSIGKLAFHDVSIQEENREKGIIVKKGHEKSPQICNGKIGWELFRTTNLFLDLENSVIALCDSFETIKNKFTSFTQVPLLLDQGMTEIKAKTPKGTLRCLLDTGCTYNFINIDNPDQRPLEEIVWDKTRKENFKTFYIGNFDMGKTIFHPLPIKLPIQVEAILGMEFLLKHRVFIDFSKEQIYFSIR